MLNRRRLLLLLVALVLTFCVRGLTLQFMRAHLHDHPVGLALFPIVLEERNIGWKTCGTHVW